MADEKEIVEDIKKIAKEYGLNPGAVFTRSRYLTHHNCQYSSYDIYDGGRSWQHYCDLAGYKTNVTKKVPDEVYFSRLKTATNTLGRLPLSSERKKFGLNFSKKRYPNLESFFISAEKAGYITHFRQIVEKSTEQKNTTEILYPTALKKRFIPPIPLNTKKKSWARTNIDGFPYAPQDELGVVALFSILCAKSIIPWQILSLNGGKGIDSICFDDNSKKEIEVELKFRLTEHSWNHHQHKIDYIVCWENKWLNV